MNTIPVMTHPLGRHWQQPPLDRIAIDDTHALMTMADYNGLAEYSRSMPTGVYPGKAWRAEMRDGRRYLRWYGECDETRCTNNQREILIADEAAP